MDNTERFEMIYMVQEMDKEETAEFIVGLLNRIEWLENRVARISVQVKYND